MTKLSIVFSVIFSALVVVLAACMVIYYLGESIMINQGYEPNCYLYAGRFASGEAYICTMPITGGIGGEKSIRGTVKATASKSSLRRLRRYLENCITKYNKMITLTYGEDFPRAGQSKTDLNDFMQKLFRGSEGVTSAVWVMEFQKRGAVHYHILCDGGFIHHERVAAMWFASTKGKSSIMAGTRTEAIFQGNANLSKYLSKYLSKSYQKVSESGVSEDDLKRGRFWGVRGNREVKPMEATNLIVDRVSLEELLKNAVKLWDAREFDNGVWWRDINKKDFDMTLSGIGGFDIKRYQNDSIEYF